MQPISRGEWEEWSQHIVTKAFMMAAQERIIDAMYALSTQAGMDSNQDNFMRGLIYAYRELEGFRIDDLMENVE